MGKIKILVVDDKRVVGDLFTFTLGSQGHTIRSISNASEAIESAKFEKFDIAFLDIMMPGIDGIMLLKQIKSIAPALPVVMMTGFSVEGKRRELKKLGALPVLKKPFEIDDVRKLIREVLKKEI